MMREGRYKHVASRPESSEICKGNFTTAGELEGSTGADILNGLTRRNAAGN